MKVVTGMVRFSYANVFEPKSINGSAPKYSVSLIIPKDDTDTLGKIRTAIESAYTEGCSNGKLKAAGKTAPALSSIHTPLRDGDIDRPDDPAYANSYFVNANATRKPGVVDKNLNDILDPEELMSGDYGRASISFYAYNNSGNRGIACGLNHIQKLKTGEHFTGRTTAAGDFGSPDGEDILL